VRTKQWLAAAIACIFGVLLFLVGVAPRALAAGDPTAATVYGCIVGSSRTLENVYTTASGFSTLLQANSGNCPSGFAVGIGKNDYPNDNYLDLPSTEPVYGCVESGRTLEYVYESESNFLALLSANVNACPSGGFIVFIGPANSMPAQSPLPSEAPVWGCVESGRTLEDVYTNESSYDTWLSGQGGKCPTSGFQATLGHNYSCSLTDASGNTDDFATCGPYADLSVPSGSTESVNMNFWDATGCHTGDTCSQRLDANNDSDWQFTADMVNNPPSSYVLSYPNQQTILPAISTGKYEPYGGYQQFSGSWAQTDPGTSASTAWESAYDIWYGGYATGGSPGTGNSGYEIMIWTVNNNDTPAGSLVSGDTCTDGAGGPTFDVYASSNTDGYPNTVTLLPTSNLSASSSLNFAPLFQCLDGSGFINDAAMNEPGATGTWTGNIAGLYSMDYGWEVQSTNNVPETFTMDHYALTAS
jgi:hypothetical protein